MTLDDIPSCIVGEFGKAAERYVPRGTGLDRAAGSACLLCAKASENSQPPAGIGKAQTQKR